MIRVVLIVAALVLSVSTAPAGAQNYPARSVRILVPFSPGGGADTMARVLGKQLSARMGQGFVIENRPGAEGTLGTDAAAKSPPDGYTLVMLANGLVTSAAVRKDLPYNSRRDLAPVAFIGEGPLVLVVGAKVPANNVQELLQLAKTRPGELSFAGAEASISMATEMLIRGMNVNIQVVPYKGAGQAVGDIVGGHISGIMTTFSSVRQQISTNNIRALAVTTLTRSPSYPDLPTLNETVVPGYDFLLWFLLAAPGGTPRPILAQLNKETVAVFQVPESSSFLATAGLTPVTLSLDGVQERITREFDKWESTARGK